MHVEGERGVNGRTCGNVRFTRIALSDVRPLPSDELMETIGSTNGRLRDGVTQCAFLINESKSA